MDFTGPLVHVLINMTFVDLTGWLLIALGMLIPFSIFLYVCDPVARVVKIC